MATDGSLVHLFAVSSSPAGLKGFRAVPLKKSHGRVFDMTHTELQGCTCASFGALALWEVWQIGVGILNCGLNAL